MHFEYGSGGINGAKAAVGMLQAAGMADVKLNVYDGMGHEACATELDDVLSFLRRAVPGTEERSKL